MLVLSRYKDESIMIGKDIEVLILGIQGGKIRLGIMAPRSTPVHRREVYEAICREKIDQYIMSRCKNKAMTACI